MKRTTLILDEALILAAKRLALERQTTLTRVVEESLRAVLRKDASRKPKSTLLPAFGEGGLRPGVDLDDKAQIRELTGGYDPF